MVEFILFIGTICLFFYLPVQFRFFYQKVAQDDTLIFEMIFLNGLLRRRRIINILDPTTQGVKVREKNSGNWMFYKKRDIVKKTTPYFGNSRGLREFLHRHHHFGLGVTLLTYFLPARYQHWLLVIERLEKKGEFKKFTWVTKLGLGEPAGTAIVYGLLWSFKSGLVNGLAQKYRFAQKPEIKVIADYRSVNLDVLFDCIFHIKLGYIIIASILAYWRHRMMKGGVGIE